MAQLRPTVGSQLTSLAGTRPRGSTLDAHLTAALPRPSTQFKATHECGGLLLALILSAANANDATMLEDIPAIRIPTGRRRRRPGKVHADKAYEHRRCRRYLHRRGIKPRIARRRIESSARLGRHRWTVERTGAWLGGFRRLRTALSVPPNALRLGHAGLCGDLLQRLQQPPW